jgi:hypothetical protein
MKVRGNKHTWRTARSQIWSLAKIAARIKLGFGQGTLADYLPWISGRDLSSIGTATRLWSAKTGRTMEFLSDIERNTFLVAEFRKDFFDYWEQWPLERNWTLWAAGRLGYRHPFYPKAKRPIPVVMTVDGVLTLVKDGTLTRKAIDCKSAKAVDDPRTKEKLAISKLACERFAYPHVVVTEESYSRKVIQNILWVRYAVARPYEPEPVPGAFDMWPVRLHKHLTAALADPAFDARQLLMTFCANFDAAHKLPRGLALRCMKLLMWQHLVEFDLKAIDAEKLRICDLAVNDYDVAGRGKETTNV